MGTTAKFGNVDNKSSFLYLLTQLWSLISSSGLLIRGSARKIRNNNNRDWLQRNMSMSVTLVRIMLGKWTVKSGILKLAVVRILFPKPHMLLFSFIININYPAGEERFNVYHQTSGFGKSFAEENTTCEIRSVQPPFSDSFRPSFIQRKKWLCCFIDSYIYCIA